MNDYCGEEYLLGKDFANKKPSSILAGFRFPKSAFLPELLSRLNKKGGESNTRLWFHLQLNVSKRSYEQHGY